MSARGGGGKKKGAKKKAPSWQCNWCQTSKTSKHHRGPDGPLRAVQPLPRLRLVRRRAPGVPQLPRDDHDAYDDRELELGKPTNDITGRIGARRNVDVLELFLGGRVVHDQVLARFLEEHPCRNPRLG